MVQFFSVLSVLKEVRRACVESGYSTAKLQKRNLRVRFPSLGGGHTPGFSIAIALP
jgi:hypothetical protein